MIPDAVMERVRAAYSPERIVRVHEPALGLTAYLVIDNDALGPAAGGVRTHAYASEVDAALDACRLARAMTYKCAIAGLDAGGGKIVVMDRPDLQREAAFSLIGKQVEALGGDFRTAGDLGTTDEDLATLARETRYVSTDSARLAAAVGRGVLRCAEAIADHAGRPGISGLRVAIQGAGDIGAAVAHALAEAGARLSIADLHPERAERVAVEVGAAVLSPAEVLFADVDLIAPCAVGDVLDVDVVGHLRAWAICGGANNICADDATHRALVARNIVFVPDLLSSAGAVIEGIGRTVMGMEDRGALIDTLRQTARLVLADADRSGEPPVVHAIRRAKARIDRAA